MKVPPVLAVFLAVIATAPLGGREDVDRAVAAARKAFDDPKGWPTWAAARLARRRAVDRAAQRPHR